MLAGAVLGFLGVAAGAFGAHALAAKLSPAMKAIWETAARYHLLHAILLVVVAVMRRREATRALAVAHWALLLGVLIFSGTLYLLAVTGVRWLGAITPIGGTALLVGWAAIAVHAFKMR
ncbi:MAG: DUF423 domain-containing protein [Myxococcales bacterium]|nr:DUF423 domain-containing protein [Myxococcales bacterium]